MRVFLSRLFATSQLQHVKYQLPFSVYIWYIFKHSFSWNWTDRGLSHILAPETGPRHCERVHIFLILSSNFISSFQLPSISQLRCSLDGSTLTILWLSWMWALKRLPCKCNFGKKRRGAVWHSVLEGGVWWSIEYIELKWKSHYLVMVLQICLKSWKWDARVSHALWGLCPILNLLLGGSNKPGSTTKNVVYAGACPAPSSIMFNQFQPTKAIQDKCNAWLITTLHFQGIIGPNSHANQMLFGSPQTLNNDPYLHESFQGVSAVYTTRTWGSNAMQLDN